MTIRLNKMTAGDKPGIEPTAVALLFPNLHLVILHLSVAGHILLWLAACI